MAKLFKMKKRRSNASSSHRRVEDQPGNRTNGPAEDIYTNAQSAPHARDAFAFRHRRRNSPASESDNTDEKISEEVE
jgi:hypothetical protein